MQVVFVKDVAKLARKGDLKNVKDGYFMNYLLPRGLAVVATASRLREVEEMKKHMLLEKERIAEQAQEIKKKLDGITLSISRKARGEKLYGSVGEKDIIALLEKETKVRLGPENISLKEHIKVVGSHEISIKLSEGVDARIILEIKAEK